MASSAGKCWSCLLVALFFIFLLPFSLCSADPAPIQELVSVNMTTLQEAKEITEQVSYNISSDREQMHVNAYPLSKGVSRISGKMNVGDSFQQDTTREYNVRQNTTLDEKQFTGELPETPLRAVIPSSSYKVMCQFADDLREKLCFFWKELYPILVRLVAVFVVGVITAALILELLKLVYPPRQNKGMLHLSDTKDSNILLPLMLSHDQLTVKALEAGSIL